jgi:hypothetical protein
MVTFPFEFERTEEAVFTPSQTTVARVPAARPRPLRTSVDPTGPEVRFWAKDGTIRKEAVVVMPVVFAHTVYDPMGSAGTLKVVEKLPKLPPEASVIFTVVRGVLMCTQLMETVFPTP